MTPAEDQVERVARAICDYKERPCPGSACKCCQDKARAALSAAIPEGEVPKGWRVVPVEPTTVMCMVHAKRLWEDWTAYDLYRAMLAAAPSPPARETDSEPEFIDHRVVDLGASGIGAHSVGGFGVPHDGCGCGTCQDARTGGPETAPPARETAPFDSEMVAALEEAREIIRWWSAKGGEREDFLKKSAALSPAPPQEPAMNKPERTAEEIERATGGAEPDWRTARERCHSLRESAARLGGPVHGSDTARNLIWAADTIEVEHAARVKAEGERDRWWQLWQDAEKANGNLAATVEVSESRIIALEASRDALVKALEDARGQIEYLHDKFQPTGSGNAVLAKVAQALRAARDAPDAPALDPVTVEEVLEVVDALVAGDPALESILFGREPDDAPMQVTMKLGIYRRARALRDKLSTTRKGESDALR